MSKQRKKNNYDACIESEKIQYTLNIYFRKKKKKRKERMKEKTKEKKNERENKWKKNEIKKERVL